MGNKHLPSAAPASDVTYSTPRSAPHLVAFRFGTRQERQARSAHALVDSSNHVARRTGSNATRQYHHSTPAHPRNTARPTVHPSHATGPHPPIRVASITLSASPTDARKRQRQRQSSRAEARFGKIASCWFRVTSPPLQRHGRRCVLMKRSFSRALLDSARWLAGWLARWPPLGSEPD